MIYRIRDWDKHYENCETKRFKHLRWVPISNQHDGKYWRKLWTLDRAPDIFAAFILMVELASKMPARGTLADEDGELSTGDMALKTGAPEDIFVYAIPILCDLKWLEPAADLRQTCRPNRIEQNRIEQNNKGTAGGRVKEDLPAIPSHLAEVWDGFVEMRKAKKKPLTNRAVALILKTLASHSPDVQVKMVEQSIKNAWTDVYELKGKLADNLSKMRNA